MEFLSYQTGGTMMRYKLRDDKGLQAALAWLLEAMRALPIAALGFALTWAIIRLSAMDLFAAIEVVESLMESDGRIVQTITLV